MSGLTKFFIILNLLLSLLFFGTSATLFLTRQALHEQLQAEREAYAQAKQQLELENAQHKSDLALARDAVTKLSLEEAELAKDLRIATEGFAAAEQRADLAAISRDTAQQNATAKSIELASANTRNQELQGLLQTATTKRDEALASASAANESRNRAQQDLEEANKQLAQLKEEHTQLVADYQQTSLRVAVLERAIGSTPVPSMPTPPLDARIISVDHDLNAVVLNVGQDQEVQVGFEFTIHRGGKYVGKVKVTRLYRDNSGARIVAEKEGMSIEKGDSATTRVNSLNS